jgi:phosphatidylserine decarboxylase
VRNQNKPVATEGYPFIAIFALATIVFAILGWVILAPLTLFLTLFTVYFFRNP